MSVNSQIETIFPGLKKSNYKITSPSDISYNCIAWAVGHNDLWWQPDPCGIYYWPEGIAREFTIGAYIAVFQLLGFEECDKHNLQNSYDKIAIYAKDNKPTHAARQMDSGSWTSKLGALVDIEHNLSDLCGNEYGEVVRILKRNKTNS